MTSPVTIASAETRAALEQELAFKAEALQCVCRLTIYWQNEIWRDGREAVASGFHVQALPREPSSRLVSFTADGVTLWADPGTLEEIAGKTITSRNGLLVLT